MKEVQLLKHTATIHIDHQDLSSTEMKTGNILLKYAYANLQTQNEHQINIAQLASCLGWSRSNNDQYLKEALEKLATTKIKWNIFNKDKKQEWGVMTVLSYAKIRNGVCFYSYPEPLREFLQANDKFRCCLFGGGGLSPGQSL